MTDWPRFATVVSLTYQALLLAASIEDSLELDSLGQPARKLGLQVLAKGNDLAAVMRGPRDFVPDEVGSLKLGPTKAAVVSAYFFSYVFDNSTTVYGKDMEVLSRIVGKTGPCTEADRAGTELLNYSRASFVTKFISRDERGYSNGVVLLSVTASMVAVALLLAGLSKCMEPGTTARDVMTTAILGCDGFSGGDDVSSMGPVIVGVLELESSYHVQIVNADEKAAHAPDYATKIPVLEPGEEIDIGKPVR